MKETGEKFQKDFDIDLFMETSAKTGMNAQELFIEAAKILYEDYNEYKSEKKKSQGDTLKKNKKIKKKGCCGTK